MIGGHLGSGRLGRKRDNVEDSDAETKEILRGQNRALRKQIKQLQREVARLNGLLDWGFLEEPVSPIVPSPKKSSETTERESATSCPNSCGVLVELKRPDGSVLWKCTTCLYKRVKK